MFGWRQPAKGRVGSALVMVPSSGLDLDLRVRQREEPMSVQALFVQAVIEALREGCRRACLDPRRRV